MVTTAGQLVVLSLSVCLSLCLCVCVSVCVSVCLCVFGVAVVIRWLVSQLMAAVVMVMMGIARVPQ